VVSLKGPSQIVAKAGEKIILDARDSRDPDGNRLTFHWFHYAEAGANNGSNLADIRVVKTGARATITAISPCRKVWIDSYLPCKGNGTAHIILAVTDTGKPALTRYQRIILTVEPKS
jgi:hypothetical protein